MDNLAKGTLRCQFDFLQDRKFGSRKLAQFFKSGITGNECFAMDGTKFIPLSHDTIAIHFGWASQRGQRKFHNPFKFGHDHDRNSGHISGYYASQIKKPRGDTFKESFKLIVFQISSRFVENCETTIWNKLCTPDLSLAWNHRFSLFARFLSRRLSQLEFVLLRLDLHVLQLW